MENGRTVIYHSGILGMRWGQRNYQNADGTLTEAGKARYNSDGSHKNPKDMSDEDLKKANARLTAESNYRNLTGTTQPGKSINRDTAIKIGAAFVATAAGTFLYRQFKTGKWYDQVHVKSGSKRGQWDTKSHSIGHAFTIAALAGGIGALIVGANALGGQVAPTAEAGSAK
jgi:hypothetical protein